MSYSGRYRSSTGYQSVTPYRPRGPAPMASIEDLSLASFDMSPDDTAAATATSRHRQQQQHQDGAMEDNNRRAAGNYQRLLGRLEDNGEEREILQARRDNSITFSYREGYSGQEILRSTEGLDEHVRPVYVRRSSNNSSDHYNMRESGIEHAAPYNRYNFRMIDASATDLRDPTDRSRRYSAASSIVPSDAALGQRHGSVSSESTLRSGGGGGSPSGKVAMETSFCGPKPIPSQSFDMEGALRQPPSSTTPRLPPSHADSPVDLGDDDRDLIEEINRRMQYPLTKQDSYANAIYSGARRSGVRKQGSYEAAVESGLNASAAIKKNREIQKMRKQDSYARAIGGSFEDSLREEDANSNASSNPNRSPGLRMKKQESYLLAVGEMSPDSDVPPTTSSISPTRGRIRKQESYQRAMATSTGEDELTPLPSRNRSIRKQESYQRAMQAGSLSFSDSFDRSLSSNQRRPMRKQDSYQKAVMGDLDEDGPVTSNEPLSLKKRQDSYLQAVGVSPEDELGPTKRSWKVRQDSYQRAIDISPEEQVKVDDLIKTKFGKPRRQDSYLEAIAGDYLIQSESANRKNSWKSRQDSYQKAQDLPLEPLDDGNGNDEDAAFHVGQRRIQRVDTDSMSSCSEDFGFRRSNSFKTRGYGAVLTALAPTKAAAPEDDLPDLECADVQKATIKIQAAFRGFTSRKKTMASAADAAIAARKIQRAYRRFQREKASQTKAKAETEVEVVDIDLSDKDVAHAALKIQSVYRGFQTRRRHMQSAFEVAQAAIKIQKAYRRFKARKAKKAEEEEDLPDLQCKDVQHAAMKIQSVYRGFQTRRQMKSTFEAAQAALKIQKAFRKFKAKKKAEAEDLPDLKDKDVQIAAVKIQAVYRGFTARRQIKTTSDAVVSAMKIQAAFRGFKARRQAQQAKELKALVALPEAQVAARRIQAAYRGYNTRRDFASTVLLAQSAAKIQAAYRGFQVRKAMKKRPKAVKAMDEDLPDLNCKDVAAATLKIQSVYRGFKTRKQVTSTFEAAKAAMTIQKAFRRFKAKKDEQAAVRIQSLYRGHQARRQVKVEQKAVSAAAVTLQANFRGYKARKEMELKGQDDDLPDLGDPDVAVAAVKIQSVYRGFQARKSMKSTLEVATAALTIQKAYRRFKQRKKEEKEEDDAARCIQSLYRGFQSRKKVAPPPSSTVMKTQMPPAPGPGSSRIMMTKIGVPMAVDERVKARPPRAAFAKMQLPKDELVEDKSGELLRHPGDVVAAAITLQRFFRRLRERNRLKKKRLAAKAKLQRRSRNRSSSTEGGSSATESRSETAGSSSTESKGIKAVTSSESSEGGKNKESSDYDDSDTDIDDHHLDDDDAARVIQRKFKEYQGRSAATKQAIAEALHISGTGSGGGGAKPKGRRLDPTTPAPSIDFDNVAPTATAAGLTDKQTALNQTFGVRNQQVRSPLPARSSKLKEVPIPTVPPSKDMDKNGADESSSSIAQSALGMIRQSSLGNFFKRDEAEAADQPQPASLPPLLPSVEEQVGPKEEKKKGGFFSSLLRRGEKKKEEAPAPAVPPKGPPEAAIKAKSDMKGDDDLIHVVLSAVEENWLNQAPHPTLDKNAALQHDDELSESERDANEKEVYYDKGRDDETAGVLDRPDDAQSEDFPFLETTLPQERPGIISITPSHQRVSECKLASINRPRSASPKNPAKIDDFTKQVAVPSEKIKVKLPKQDSISRPKPQPESWESFSSKGLKTFKSSDPPLPPAPSAAARPLPPVPARPPPNREWIDFDQEGGEPPRGRPTSRQPPPVPKRH